MRPAASNRRGFALLYTVVALVGFTAMVTLGVDLAHVRMVKIQLQGAADYAARAGARVLSSGVTAVQNAVVASAAANTADGASVVVDPNNDIDFGTWSNGTFTVLTGASQSSANAIRVRCAHTAAKGNAVNVIFGSLIGITSEDVSAQSTATGTPTMLAGFIGYAGITAKNNTTFGGYSSSVTTNPTTNSMDANMRVGSNSFITAKNNDEIDGDDILGPGATIDGFTVLGNPSNLSSPIPTPTMPAWNPGTNPNSIPQNYTVGTTTTLPGGTYWFTSLTLNADLTFSGAAVVYVNGSISVYGTLAPTSGIPSDLTIYEYGSSTSFGDSGSNGMNITARVFAPNTDFTAKNNLFFAGTGVFNTITTKNNANFYYDEDQGPANGGYTVATVN
jgi:Flp pilus assembly protein TadG